jgi:hypothetical protein
MKNFIFTAAILFTATLFGNAQDQPPVVDTHPNATIYIYDPQSSQEVLAQSNDAILFKDALVNLVSNVSEAKIISHSTPGHKTIVVTQASPEQGNVYQIVMNDRMLGQTSVLYTFSYNVDKNTLYYFDPNSQTWVDRPIQPNNISNLNDCQAYGKFNDPQSWNTQADDGTGDDVVQANTPPPALQEEVQPECPVDGYLWQPGYWAYSRYNGNYYWVAGTWVAPPRPGYLWTPPYWGFEGGIYGFHRGYWGITIGFYGGINYGYGYVGHGYYGGVWEGEHFRYNTAVVRVNTTVVHNTYVDRTVIINNTTVNNTTVNNTTVNRRTSFNGPGGVIAKPTPAEVAVASKPHIVDNSQDPKATMPAQKNRGNAGQTNSRPFTPADNGNRNSLNGTPPQKTQGNNINVQKTPVNSSDNQKVDPNNPDAQKTSLNDISNQKTSPNTMNAQKYPTNGYNNQQNAPNNRDVQKAPVIGTNGQKPAQSNVAVPKVPGNIPPVPSAPGKVADAPRAVGNNQQVSQRQALPRQTGAQKESRQPANKPATPPSKNKKDQ